MKNLEKIFSFAVLGISLFLLGAVKTQAATLDISKPVANERVVGNIEIRWSVFNAGVQDVPYDLSLNDINCSNGFSIQGSRFAQTVKNGYYTSNVDTRTVSDGRRCLRLCVFNFSQCTYKTIDVVNYSNQAPRILNYPSQLTFTTKQVFKHTVSYMDPDGDPVSLVLLQGPRFLVLEQNGFSTIGEYFVPGTYYVSFMAVDKLGAAAYQNFTIVVNAAPTPTPTPSVTKTPTLTPTVTAIPTAKGNLSFEVVSPTKDSQLQGIENPIEWKYNDGDKTEFKKLVIEYTKTGSDQFNEVYTSEDVQESQYFWDVSNIEPGDYELKFSLYNGDDKLTKEVLSPVFKIIETTGKISIKIDNFNPPNKSEFENKRPEISASFYPSTGGQILVDQVEIKLDNKNISNKCSIDASGFKCTLDSDLKVGGHTVSVTITDSNDQKASQEWGFTIKDGTVSQPVNKSGGLLDFLKSIDWGGNQLKTLYLCCGALLILLLFIFVIRTLRQRKAYDTQVSDFNSTKTYSTPSSEPEFDESKLESEPYDFSVGRHDVVSDVEPTVPQIETTSTEMPDWLRGDETASANPIDTTGNPVDLQGQDASKSVNEQSQVHESFDLAKANYGDEDASS